MQNHNSRHSKGILVGIKIAACFVLLYFVGGALLDHLRSITWSTLKINWMFLAAALTGVILHRISSALGHTLMVRAFGHRLNQRSGTAIFLIASLGKYIPGKFAAPLGAIAMLRARGVPVFIASTTVFSAILVSLVLMFILSSPLLLVVWQSDQPEIARHAIGRKSAAQLPGFPVLRTC